MTNKPKSNSDPNKNWSKLLDNKKFSKLSEDPGFLKLLLHANMTMEDIAWLDGYNTADEDMDESTIPWEKNSKEYRACREGRIARFYSDGTPNELEELNHKIKDLINTNNIRTSNKPTGPK